MHSTHRGRRISWPISEILRHGWNCWISRILALLPSRGISQPVILRIVAPSLGMGWYLKPAALRHPKISQVYQIGTAVSLLFVLRLYHAYALLHAGLPKKQTHLRVSKFIIYVGFKEVTVTVCMFVLVIHRYVSSPCIRVFMIIIIIIIIIFILNSSWRSFFGFKVSLGFLTIRFKARLPCGKGHPTKPSAQGIHTLGMCHTLVR